MSEAERDRSTSIQHKTSKALAHTAQKLIRFLREILTQQIGIRDISGDEVNNIQNQSERNQMLLLTVLISKILFSKLN